MAVTHEASCRLLSLIEVNVSALVQSCFVFFQSFSLQELPSFSSLQKQILAQVVESARRLGARIRLLSSLLAQSLLFLLDLVIVLRPELHCGLHGFGDRAGVHQAQDVPASQVRRDPEVEGNPNLRGLFLFRIWKFPRLCQTTIQKNTIDMSKYDSASPTVAAADRVEDRPLIAVYELVAAAAAALLERCTVECR